MYGSCRKTRIIPRLDVYKRQALLMRARSPKDQSYMLANLPRSVLERCVFPLGEAADKAEVRELARESQIPVAEKKDSMDVCFIQDGDYSAWLESRGAALPEGNFVDETGRVLGRHKGPVSYTHLDVYKRQITHCTLRHLRRTKTIGRSWQLRST